MYKLYDGLGICLKNTRTFRAKALKFVCPSRRSSPCIFQVVASTDVLSLLGLPRLAQTIQDLTKYILTSLCPAKRNKRLQSFHPIFIQI
jgi:hypothetical protein